MTLTYNHTRRACYFGYITQAIVNNLTPLLFIIFQADYHLSYEKLGGLILLNFMVQMTVDILVVQFADKIGFRVPLVCAHICCAGGLVLLSVLPVLFQSAYLGLVIAVIIYAVGGGLLEVLVSPVVESLPTPEHQKASIMSLLHSFYCWGQVGVVAVSTLLLGAIGSSRWQLLPLVWALVPLFNMLLFLKVPMAPAVPEHKRTSLRALFTKPAFLGIMIIMVCAGSSELTISQWSSMFAEQGLGLSKVWGDLAGPCMFAILMGLGRIFYGIWGQRIKLARFMTLCALLCVLCYLTTALSSNPAVSLIACAVSGFSVAIMWPGGYSIASNRFPLGGTAMFGILAMCGDIGCATGPWMAGLVADSVASGKGLFHAVSSRLLHSSAAGLKAGILVGTLSPLILLVTLRALNAKKAEE